MNKTYLAIVILVAILGLLVAFKYTSSSSPVQSAAATATSTTRTQTKVFDLVVQNRKLVSGPSTISVTQNDNVTITITVDENEELHLHGYNLHVDLEKGIPGSLSFVASSSGRFPYELEHSSTEIGALEVQPQ